MLSDLKIAFRRLAGSPGFTTVALVTLAVGIGSATVVFAAVNALFLKQVPLIDRATEERLVHLSLSHPNFGTERIRLSYPDYLSLRERATTLAGVLVHRDRTVIIAGLNEPERVYGTEISWDAFALLGVLPLHGRPFGAADDAADAPEVALISHAFWRRRFGGEPTIVGTTVTMNGRPVVIVGIMPEGWRYPNISDIWTPLRLEPGLRVARGDRFLEARARLQPGVTLAEARTEAEAIMGALAQEFPLTNQGLGARLLPIREEATQNIGHLTLLLFGAVLFVFLIACLNVANLLLARGAARAKEYALRLALGARRTHLVRQLLAESLVLGLGGAVGGLVIALWGCDAMIAVYPEAIPFWLRFDFDPRVFAFVFGLAMVGAVAFGLVPAFRASRPDLVAELKEGGRTADVDGPRSQQLRHALVIAEVAIALVLLVGAGLMMRSFLFLQHVERGYDPAGVLTFRTGLPPALFGKDLTVPVRFFDQLLARLRETPGIDAAGAVSLLPGSDEMINGYVLEGQPEPAEPNAVPHSHTRFADAGYFRTLQVPLLAGRHFDESRDLVTAPPVVIVDEVFAKRHFGSIDAALGRRIKIWEPGLEKAAIPHPVLEMGPKINPAQVWAEIVGVVGTVRHRLDRPTNWPTIYYALRQCPSNFLSIVIRANGKPSRWAETAREATLATDRGIPIYHVRPLSEVELLRFPQVRFFTRLFLVFGVVALLLACIGIYGVMSYSVSLRTQELGLRMALGAQAGDVVRMVIRHGLGLVGLGLGAGLVAAFSLAHLLSGILHGVSPHDPPTFAVVPLLLATVALVACWLPSRRATLVPPSSALRAG